MICVRYTQIKTKNSYFTFLSNEGMTYLREYMETRISDGDVLTPETPLFKLGPLERITHSFIRKAIVRSRVLMNTLCLKGLVGTVLDYAENKVLISHP